MYRIILYILVLFLYAETCSGVTNKNGDNENPSKCLVQVGEFCLDKEDVAYGSILTIVVGLSTKIDAKLFQQAVDKVLETYNRHPKTIATLGLFLSIASLKDSIDDYDKIAMYDSLINTALRDKDEDSRLERLKGIKMLLNADIRRQQTMGVIKGLFAMVFGVTVYYTAVGWSVWPMAGAAILTSLATLINAYNYQRFSILMTKLKQDGHLD